MHLGIISSYSVGCSLKSYEKCEDDYGKMVPGTVPGTRYWYLVPVYLSTLSTSLASCFACSISDCLCVIALFYVRLGATRGA